MSHVVQHPEQPIESALPEPEGDTPLENRIAQAEPAAGAGPSESERPEQRLRGDVAERTYEPKVEAHSRISSATDGKDELGSIRDVPLSQINGGEVNGEEHLGAGRYEELRQELERLQELRTYVEAGLGEQTADAWDREQSLGHYSAEGYTRGYTDAYKTYYETNPVALSPTADGRYDIMDGRHRVNLAREMGLPTLPARVV